MLPVARFLENPVGNSCFFPPIQWLGLPNHSATRRAHRGFQRLDPTSDLKNAEQTAKFEIRNPSEQAAVGEQIEKFKIQELR
jgi:hypothetical protein